MLIVPYLLDGKGRSKNLHTFMYLSMCLRALLRALFLARIWISQFEQGKAKASAPQIYAKALQCISAKKNSVAI